MTDVDLEELEALLKEATPGPWQWLGEAEREAVAREAWVAGATTMAEWNDVLLGYTTEALNEAADKYLIALRPPTPAWSEEAVESAAWAIAYWRWPLATEGERRAWADRTWKDEIQAARAALATLTEGR